MLGASGRLCVTDLIGSHVRFETWHEYRDIIWVHGVRCTVQVAWGTMYRVVSSDTASPDAASSDVGDRIRLTGWTDPPPGWFPIMVRTRTLGSV